MNLYNTINAVGTYMLFIYNLLHYREKSKILGGVSTSAMNFFAKKHSRGIFWVLSRAAVWTVLEILIISYAQYLAGGIFNTMLGKALDTGANYFGMIYVAPFLVMIACALLRIDYLPQMDLITPAYPLALVFVKISCYMTGCCRGIPWEHGFYNPVSRLIEFPAQLLESFVALVLFIALVFCRKKLKRGTVFPVYLMAYSGLRFFTEFLRCEPNVFMGLKVYQFLCIIGVVFGLLQYIAVIYYTKRKQRKANGNIV